MNSPRPLPATDDGAGSRHPLRGSVTVVITAVTSLVSLLILVGGLGNVATMVMGFIPARLSGAMQVGGGLPALLTIFSSTLVHGGYMHLLFNMLMLMLCGTAVERVLGREGILVIYPVSAVVAALAQWSVGPLETSPVIGASGAVSGVIGAYALSFGRPRQFVRSPRTNRTLHILWLAAAWTVLQIGVWYVAGTEGVLLAAPAHVGGFIVGLLLQRPLLLWRYRGA